MKTIIFAFIAICSLPFFFVGLYEAYRNTSEISSFVETEGLVVGNSYITTIEEGNAAGSYLPEVEFSLPNGTKSRFTDKIGSVPPDYEIGSKVKIIYEPENPSNARINSWKRIWLAPVILMTVGLLPLVISLIILRRLNI